MIEGAATQKVITSSNPWSPREASVTTGSGGQSRYQRTTKRSSAGSLNESWGGGLRNGRGWSLQGSAGGEKASRVSYSQEESRDKTRFETRIKARTKAEIKAEIKARANSQTNSRSKARTKARAKVKLKLRTKASSKIQGSAASANRKRPRKRAFQAGGLAGKAKRLNRNTPSAPARERSRAGLAEAYMAGKNAALAVFGGGTFGGAVLEGGSQEVNPPAVTNTQGQGASEPAKPVELFRRSLADWFGVFSAQRRPGYREALSLGFAFREGYARTAGFSPDSLGLPVPLTGRVTAVITACNEEKTIGPLLDELGRLPLYERIVVLNGCTDGSFAEVRKRDNVIVAYDPERLGHDVGRSVGASLAGGDSLLFVDGDMQVPAVELAAFLYEQEGGTDVVLNDISAFLPAFEDQDEVTRCKGFLNQALGRADLGSSSLTAVPHVLSRRAVEVIGTAALAVPPKAQAAAILEGLTVSAPCTADVIRRNRLRQGNSGAGNKVAQLIIGDHAEALHEALKRLGPRLFWQNIPRQELAKARNG